MQYIRSLSYKLIFIVIIIIVCCRLSRACAESAHRISALGFRSPVLINYEISIITVERYFKLAVLFRWFIFFPVIESRVEIEKRRTNDWNFKSAYLDALTDVGCINRYLHRVLRSGRASRNNKLGNSCGKWNIDTILCTQSNEGTKGEWSLYTLFSKWHRSSRQLM